MELTALPDDALVAVMQLLGVRDLLSCRLACKWLGKLALHPDAWRRRALDLFEDSPGCCICPVLRLAPCALSMQVEFPGSLRRYGCSSSAEAITTSKCAVNMLRVFVDEHCGVPDANALILQQQALGRLKELRLYVFCTQKDETLLLRTVASMTSLERLLIHTSLDARKPASIPSRLRITPSLKSFEFESGRNWPFIQKMLSGHAATLETVLVSGLRAPHSLAPLVAGMPNLTSLKCDCFPGIKGILAAASLRELHLEIYSYGERGAKGADVTATAAGILEAAELLRRAEHLRAVTLEYTFPLFSTEILGADLVLALASSGRSPLETLCIEAHAGVRVSGFPQLKPLISALPGLPALLHLKVAPPDDVDVAKELLSSISPASAPALLSVDLPLRGGCARIRGRAVRAALTANPSLHITTRFRLCKDECETCELARQHDPLSREKSNLGLFSHDPEEKCLQGHSSDRLWIRVPRRPS